MSENNEDKGMSKVSVFLCAILTLDLLANLVIIHYGYYNDTIESVTTEEKKKEVVKNETVESIEKELDTNAYKLCDSIEGKDITITGVVDSIDSSGTLIQLHTDKKDLKVEMVCDENKLKTVKDNKKIDSKLSKSIKKIKVGDRVKFTGNVNNADSKQLSITFSELKKTGD